MGIEVYFPPCSVGQEYYFSDHLYVTRCLKLKGIGATRGQDISNAASRLRFAAGKGIFVRSAGRQLHRAVAPFEDAAWSVIEGLYLTGAVAVPEGGTRANSTAYSVGNLVRDPNHNRFYYECIKAGTSAASPSGLYNEFRPDRTGLWSALGGAGATIPKGTTVRRASPLTSELIYWECTTGGTKGTIEPTWNATESSTTNEVGGTAVWTARSAASYWVVDNNIIWRTLCGPGIYIEAHGVHVDQCQTYGFTNAGIHIEAGASTGTFATTNANGCSATNCRVRNCGVGVVTLGYDASQCTFINVDVEGAGAAWTGTGGVGFYDGSFTGSVLVGCQVAASDGPGYVMGYIEVDPPLFNPHGGTLIGCYQESDTPAPLGYQCFVFGGNWGANWPVNLGVKTIGTGNGDNSLEHRDLTGPKVALAGLGDQGYDRTHYHGNNDHATPNLYRGWIYQSASLGRTGWWSDSIGAPGTPGVAFSGVTATEGLDTSLAFRNSKDGGISIILRDCRFCFCDDRENQIVQLAANRSPTFHNPRVVSFDRTRRSFTVVASYAMKYCPANDVPLPLNSPLTTHGHAVSVPSHFGRTFLCLL